MRSPLIRIALVLTCLASSWAVEIAEAADLTRPPVGYRLYPGDLISISVFDHEDLHARIRIPVDGQVSFPLVGELPAVVGMQLDDFTRSLKQRLEDGYIREAVITATVLDFGPRRAVVMGSVEKPDVVELNPFAPTTAMQAIGQVGGFLESANRTAAVVIREDPQQPGRKVALPVPAADDAQALVSDVVLLPGDIVIVPRLDRVYIIGEVRHPGAVNLPSQQDLTVSKAISLAGGFEKFAREAEVQLIRGGEPIRTVDVQAILSGKTGVVDVSLRPGDTVYVPESRF